jgi:hypothetical protein
VLDSKEHLSCKGGTEKRVLKGPQLGPHGPYRHAAGETGRRAWEAMVVKNVKWLLNLTGDNKCMCSLPTWLNRNHGKMSPQHEEK